MAPPGRLTPLVLIVAGVAAARACGVSLPVRRSVAGGVVAASPGG
jgi:hypothetical protein